MQLNGSDVIIECLVEQGVDTIFGYPGGAVLNIYDALYKNSDRIRHVITAHEQAACHAADGYSRTKAKQALFWQLRVQVRPTLLQVSLLLIWIQCLW